MQGTTRATDQQLVDDAVASAPHASQLPSHRTLRNLWSKITGIYGARFTSAFGESPEHTTAGKGHAAGDLTDAGAMWQKGLAGLSRGELAAGLQRALLSADPWPPTLPEFRALCLGIPSLGTVRTLLARTSEQSREVAAFCRLMWRFIDQHQLALADERRADMIVRDAYALAREYRMALGELPAAPVAMIGYVKRPRPTRASQEIADAQKQKLAEILRLDPQTLQPIGDDEATP